MTNTHSDSMFAQAVRPAPFASGHAAPSIEEVFVSQLAHGNSRTPEDERRFRAILDALPAAIYTTDAAGRITHFNPACIGFSGRVPTLGSDHWCVTWKLFNPDGSRLPHDECPMAVALREGREVRGTEAIAERPDGTRVWFAPYPTPLKDAHGNVIGGINMLVDITDRKLAEQQERRRAHQLAAFMETAAIGLHQVGPDGTILWANEAEARMLGYRLDEYIGRNIADFHADQEAIAAMLQLLKRGERLFEHEIRLLCRDGSIKFALIDSSAYFENGEFVHSQCFTTDITERKRTHALLRQQAQELADLHRRKDEFLAMLSHELRNPLAPISNAVHLLRIDRGTQSQASQQAHTIIERQVGQLSRLVDDLLEVSRITSGRIQLRRKPVAMAGIVERGLEACRPLIEQRRHELVVTLPPASAWVFGDPVRLEQVVVNLLNNAAKYTDPGGQIHVHAEAHAEAFVLRVRDNGIGIPAGLLPDIFELFTQGERSLDRSEGGLGIGLALVRSLVQMHDGTIDAVSAVGVGSEFVVRLPLMAAPADTAALESELSRGQAQRVLVVDDNADSAESLALLLSALGHEVQVAHDSEAALARAAQFRPGVAILDIGMPGLSGYDIARRVRSDPALRNVTLIAFTGYGQEEDRRQSRAAGFDFHLTKPAPVDEIQKLLAKIGGRPAG